MSAAARIGSAPRRLDGRMVVLGVTGSIAGYKAAELCRALQAEGAEVQVAMTRAAAEFIGPLTFETLTRRRVMRDPLELLPDSRIAHIVAADSADAIVVAPATARFVSAMAHGYTDDVVTTTCLASSAPVVVAPAMDGEMYGHPATRANVARLREFGYTVVEPESGPLASGATGQGRLAEMQTIVSAVVEAIGKRPIRAPEPAARPPLDGSIRQTDLEGRRILVTAGGTAEPIDPVRYIGNRSSGRMGVAIARAATARGADVTLVAGQTSVPLPDVAELISAQTAEEMRQVVLAALPSVDALIMAAAVADFRPARAAMTKLNRGERLALELESTPDILAEASQANARTSATRRALLVGFAAETGSLERVAAKVERKGVDLLVANDVAEPESGFGSQTNRVTLYVPGMGPEPWPLMTKDQVADRLLDRVSALLMVRDAGLGTGGAADEPGAARSSSQTAGSPLRPVRAGGGGPVEPVTGRPAESAAGKPVSEVAP